MRRIFISFVMLTLAALATAQEDMAISAPQVGLLPVPRGFRGQIAAPEGQLNRLLAVDDVTTRTGAIVTGQGFGVNLPISVNVPTDAAATCTLILEYGRPGNVQRLALGDYATVDVLEWYFTAQPGRAASVLRSSLTANQLKALRNLLVNDYISAIQAERARIDAELDAEKARRKAELDAEGPVEAEP